MDNSKKWIEHDISRNQILNFTGETTIDTDKHLQKLTRDVRYGIEVLITESRKLDKEFPDCDAFLMRRYKNEFTVYQSYFHFNKANFRVVVDLSYLEQGRVGVVIQKKDGKQKDKAYWHSQFTSTDEQKAMIKDARDFVLKIISEIPQHRLHFVTKEIEFSAR